MNAHQRRKYQAWKHRVLPLGLAVTVCGVPATVWAHNSRARVHCCIVRFANGALMYAPLNACESKTRPLARPWWRQFNHDLRAWKAGKGPWPKAQRAVNPGVQPLAREVPDVMSRAMADHYSPLGDSRLRETHRHAKPYEAIRPAVLQAYELCDLAGALFPVPKNPGVKQSYAPSLTVPQMLTLGGLVPLRAHQTPEPSPATPAQWNRSGGLDLNTLPPLRAYQKPVAVIIDDFYQTFGRIRLETKS